MHVLVQQYELKLVQYFPLCYFVISAAPLAWRPCLLQLVAGGGWGEQAALSISLTSPDRLTVATLLPSPLLLPP